MNDSSSASPIHKRQNGLRQFVLREHDQERRHKSRQRDTWMQLYRAFSGPENRQDPRKDIAFLGYN